MPTDYYAILGLTRSATTEEIRLAYRRLTSGLGPSVVPDPAAGHRLAELEAAYELLSDANRRTRYDLESMERELVASERGLSSDLFGPPSTVTDPDSAGDHSMSFEEELAAVLAQIQQPRTAKARAAPPTAQGSPEEALGRALRGSDCEIVLEVSLEEAIRGAAVPATYSYQRRGAAPAESERTVEVQVPKLARPSQRLLVKGEGAPGFNGGAPGDLHVEIVYKRHPLFRVSGDDVWYYLPIAPWEAVLGAIIELPTLEEAFRVHVPAGTTSGRTFRLPGRGLPKAYGGRGDLLACLRIITPQFPTEAEKQLYLQLSQVSRFNPRRGVG